MARVPSATRENVAEPLREAFDAAVAAEVKKRGHAPTVGNWTTMLYSPEACHLSHLWSEYLRAESSLSKKVQELSMLVIAREFDSQYMWAAHVETAKKVGLSEELVAALRDRKPLPAGMKPDEAAIIKFGQEFYRTKQVSKSTFDEALKLFGVQFLVELTMLMGFYSMIAFNLKAFEIDLPAKRPEPLLPI